MKKADESVSTQEGKMILDYLKRHEILSPADAFLRQIYPDILLTH
jgi:hypothetical protein